MLYKHEVARVIFGLSSDYHGFYYNKYVFDVYVILYESEYLFLTI